MDLEVRENPVDPAIAWGIALATAIGLGVALLWPRKATAGIQGQGTSWTYQKWGNPAKAPVVAVGAATDPEVAAWLAQMRSYFTSVGIDINLFDPSEFLVMEEAPGRPLAIPNPEYWPRMAQTIVLFLQPLRRQFGKPIRIYSGYRPEAYNNALANAADKSRHMWFEAVDFGPASGDGADSRELARLAAIRYVQYGKAWDAGMGIYGKTVPSIHIDTGHAFRDWEDTDYWTNLVSMAA